MRRTRLIPLLLAGVLVRTAAAQWQATGEVGLSRLEQTGIPTSNAQTLGLTFDAYTPRTWVRLNGLGARTTSERWTGQATAIASLLGPPTQRARWEVSGMLTTFGQTGAQTAGSAEAMARALTGTHSFGVAIGLAGGVRRADAGAEPVTRALVNGWARVGGETFGVDASAVRTTTTPLNTTERPVLWYSDMSASWRHDQRFLSVAASVGFRGSNTSLIPDRTWAAAEAAAWLTSYAAIVLAGGRSPQDVVRGVPRINYASASLRLSARPRAAIPRPAPHVKGPRLTATRELIEVHVDSASAVELMADFTDWIPVALSRAGKSWRVERAVSPGLHRVMIRIDGGAWIAPANLSTSSDDLGGMVALLNVP